MPRRCPDCKLHIRKSKVKHEADPRHTQRAIKLEREALLKKGGS